MSKGLFRPGEFKDNCGFGLMAHMQGQASHDLLEKAIEALACMTHRGGIAADGKTGDGCGLLMQKPDGFLRTVAKEELNTELGEFYAVGMIFLAARCCQSRSSTCMQLILRLPIKVLKLLDGV